MEGVEGSSRPSYYAILGVSSESSLEEIKRAYRKLAMQWHPDRWTRKPALLTQAKCKFQQIQEAYSVLSDERKRALYDAGLYDANEEEDEGFTDFMNEMLSLMAQNKREEKYYSMEELQAMFIEMAQGFGFTPWDCGPSIFDDPDKSKRLHCDLNQQLGGRSCYSTLSGWGVCNTGSYCS